MPQYDLAGNPLPETKPSAPPASFGLSPLPTEKPALAPQAPAPPPERAAFDLAGNALPDAPISALNKAGETRAQEEAKTARERGNTSGRLSAIPAEIEGFKWSWGAFSLNWLWCLNHNMAGWGIGLLLLQFVPIANLISIALAIYLGVMGNKMAWQNRRYEGGLPQFMQVETAWKNWGIALFVVGALIAPIMGAVLYPVFAQARAKARAQVEQYQQDHPGGLTGGSPLPTGGTH